MLTMCSSIDDATLLLRPRCQMPPNILKHRLWDESSLNHRLTKPLWLLCVGGSIAISSSDAGRRKERLLLERSRRRVTTVKSEAGLNG